MTSKTFDMLYEKYVDYIVDVGHDLSIQYQIEARPEKFKRTKLDMDEYILTLPEDTRFDVEEAMSDQLDISEAIGFMRGYECARDEILNRMRTL